jgi:hypothetical protein
MVQATSRVLKEDVIFDKSNVTSVDWAGYSALRFAEHPDVGSRHGCSAWEEPSTGAGEEVMGATAAAIANAFFDATGVRLHQYPKTPPRVLAALATNRLFVRSQEQHDRWAERCQEPRDHDEQFVQISLARLLDCGLCVNTRELRALVPVLRDSRRVSDAMPDSSLLHS